MDDVLGVLRNYPDNALKSDAQSGTLTILVVQMESLFRNDPASRLSDELAGLDDTRDRLITGLVKLCDAHTYGPDPKKRDAAELLSHSLSTYGAGIAQQVYQAESATITNVLTNWSTKPELTAAAELIGATEWTIALDDANERFKAMYLRRTAELAADASPDTMKSKRLEVNEAWYKLRERINGFFTVTDGAEPWKTAIEQLNSLIGQYNATLSHRAGRAADKDTPQV